MNIGKFQNGQDGQITGEMDALLVGRIKLTFEPNDKGADYRVLTDTGCEVGAAWNKTAEKTGKAYISTRAGFAVPAKAGQRRTVSGQGRGQARSRMGSPEAQGGLKRRSIFGPPRRGGPFTSSMKGFQP